MNSTSNNHQLQYISTRRREYQIHKIYLNIQFAHNHIIYHAIILDKGRQREKSFIRLLGTSMTLYTWINITFIFIS